MRLVSAAAAALLAFVGSANAQTLTWYKFSKSYIQQNYSSDSAIGKLKAAKFSPGPTHFPKPATGEGCGGTDFEIHLGVQDKDMTKPNGVSAATGPMSSVANWGVVAEPANVVSSARNDYDAFATKPISFTGYYRVWNEGHDHGSTAPSNPNHVLELHPAWQYTSGSKSKSMLSSVRPPKMYAGYGASHFRPLLTSIDSKHWLKAYQDSNFVYVQLMKADNFYQLPVKVTDIQDVSGGKVALVDVFSDANHTNQIYQSLKVIVAAGSPYATKLAVGQKTFILGIFSVNLRRAIDLSAGAKKSSPASVKDALEFFAFGRPLNPAVKNGQCTTDVEADD